MTIKKFPLATYLIIQNNWSFMNIEPNRYYTGALDSWNSKQPPLPSSTLLDAMMQLEMNVEQNTQSQYNRPLDKIFEEFSRCIRLLRNHEDPCQDFWDIATRLISLLTSKNLLEAERVSIPKAAHLYLQLARYNDDFNNTSTDYNDHLTALTTKLKSLFKATTQPGDALLRFELWRCFQDLSLCNDNENFSNVKEFFDGLLKLSKDQFMSDEGYSRLSSMQKIFYLEWMSPIWCKEPSPFYNANRNKFKDFLDRNNRTLKDVAFCSVETIAAIAFQRDVNIPIKAIALSDLLEIIEKSTEFWEVRFQALKRFNEGFKLLFSNDPELLKAVLIEMQEKEQKTEIQALVKEIQLSHFLDLGSPRTNNSSDEDFFFNFDRTKEKLSKLVSPPSSASQPKKSTSSHSVVKKVATGSSSQKSVTPSPRLEASRKLVAAQAKSVFSFDFTPYYVIICNKNSSNEDLLKIPEQAFLICLQCTYDSQKKENAYENLARYLENVTFTKRTGITVGKTYYSIERLRQEAQDCRLARSGN
jgi:hypothetical protein